MESAFFNTNGPLRSGPFVLKKADSIEKNNNLAKFFLFLETGILNL